MTAPASPGDPSGMLGDVLAQPAQVEDALWRVESAGLPTDARPGGLIVAGMGGSAIGGDLAAAAIGDRAKAPVRTNRGYALPPWAGPATLVLFASYSGDTEETLAAYEQARAAGAPRVALTTGGALGAAAREDGIPVIGIPSGMQPRAAVIYMTVAALECAAACGAAPSLRAEIEAAAGTLRACGVEWGPDGSESSLPKVLARSLVAGIPVVYGSAQTAAVARRWGTQLNDEAGLPAFGLDLLDVHHCSVDWRHFVGAPHLTAVLLADVGFPPRLRARMEALRKALDPLGSDSRIVEVAGDDLVTRTLALVFLGDLVAAYAALLVNT